jgi:hypothetical protein
MRFQLNIFFLRLHFAEGTPHEIIRFINDNVTVADEIQQVMDIWT